MTLRFLLIGVALLLSGCDNKDEGRNTDDRNGYTEILERTENWHTHESYAVQSILAGADRVYDTLYRHKYDGGPKQKWKFVNGFMTRPNKDPVQFMIKEDELIVYPGNHFCYIFACYDSVVLTYKYSGPLENAVGKDILYPDDRE